MLTTFPGRSEGGNVLGSVRPSICLSIPLMILGARICRVQWRAIRTITRVLGVCLCVYNQWEYADNCTDAVDRLLILSSIKNTTYLRPSLASSTQKIIQSCQKNSKLFNKIKLQKAMWSVEICWDYPREWKSRKHFLKGRMRLEILLISDGGFKVRYHQTLWIGSNLIS